MAQLAYARRDPSADPVTVGRARRGEAFQAFQILRVAFVIAPLVAGLDKFFNLLVDWQQYLSPTIASVLPVTPHTFMLFVGVVEIIAAGIVAMSPYVGGYVVTVWLWGIIANLLMAHGFYDVALRDLGLSLGAVALTRLAKAFGYGLPGRLGTG